MTKALNFISITEQDNDIYDKLKAAGIPLDSHESDLYAKVTPESKKIIADYEFKNNVKTFRSQIDKEGWYDIPFAYKPYWDKKKK